MTVCYVAIIHDDDFSWRDAYRKKSMNRVTDTSRLDAAAVWRLVGLFSYSIAFNALIQRGLGTNQYRRTIFGFGRLVFLKGRHTHTATYKHSLFLILAIF